MPLRGVVAPDMRNPLIAVGSGDGDDLALMVALGTIGADERVAGARPDSRSRGRGRRNCHCAAHKSPAIAATCAGVETVSAEGVFPSTAALVWVLPDDSRCPMSPLTWPRSGTSGRCGFGTRGR